MMVRNIIAVVFLAGLATGTPFYVLEGRVYEFDVRAGSRMKCWGDAIMDPNETLPYALAVRGQGPPGVVWDEIADQNSGGFSVGLWGFEWTPEPNQVGVHDVYVTAYESPQESAILVEQSGVVRITVHPAKKPPIIRVGGCAIMR